MTEHTIRSASNFSSYRPQYWLFSSTTSSKSWRYCLLNYSNLIYKCLVSNSFKILWTFSIYLESVAILPQLFMVSKTGEAESITSHYLFALGAYRALYILNWIYRYYGEGFYDLIAILAGIVQTILYCDFFYLYITKGKLWFVLSFWMTWTLVLMYPIGCIFKAELWVFC